MIAVDHGHKVREILEHDAIAEYALQQCRFTVMPLRAGLRCGLLAHVHSVSLVASPVTHGAARLDLAAAILLRTRQLETVLTLDVPLARSVFFVRLKPGEWL
jgi:hypothetical protein